MLINNYRCSYRDYKDYIVVFSNANHNHFLLQDVYAEFFRYYYEKGLDENSIVNIISNEYGVPEDIVANDLEAFFEELEECCSVVAQDIIYDQYDFSDRNIYQMMTQSTIPFSATIEVTDSCNLKCVHCYRDVPQSTYWDSDTFENLLSDLKKLGTLHLTLTGGEPFLHKNFADFLKLSKKYDFVISIQTNATINTLEIMELLNDITLKDIAVSLYSTDFQVHDNITGIKGSCEESMKGIKSFIKNGLPVTINCPVMTVNKNDMYLVKSFADSVGAKCNFSFKIIPSQNISKGTDTLNCFSADFIYDCILDSKLHLYQDLLPDIRKAIPGERYCQTGFRSITFDAQGNVLICNAFRKKCGCLSNNTAEAIWKTSKELINWRNVTSKINKKCKECKAFAYCEPCPAHKFTLSRDENSIDELTCSFGKAFFDADERVRSTI